MPSVIFSSKYPIIILFRGETAFKQVFDEDISSLAIAETVKIKLLPKLVDKIAITSLL